MSRIVLILDNIRLFETTFRVQLQPKNITNLVDQLIDCLLASATFNLLPQHSTA